MFERTLRALLLLAVVQFLIPCASPAADLLGASAPPKVDSPSKPPPPPDGREGGETIADAVPILSLPFTDTGSTCGHVNDYDEECPYDSTSPDVVYSYVSPADVYVDIDLCGSAYDTKVYVYDEDLNELACNDDFYFDETCGVYVSKIESAPLPAGVTVYIVIDGYGGDCGEYLLDISGPVEECVLTCPVGATLEGEPPLEDGYIDVYNSGCQGPVYDDFQQLWGAPDGHLEFCAVSGWYEVSGLDYRDTDWFVVIADETGTVTAEFASEQRAYLFQLAPLDCATVEAVQLIQPDPCVWETMTVAGEPGESIWLWVGATAFMPPFGFDGHEFDYQIVFDGLETDVIATEERSWSVVKGLYR